MSKILGFLIGCLALALAPTVTTAADDAEKKPTEIKVGPVRITLSAQSDGGPQKSVRVNVDSKLGPKVNVAAPGVAVNVGSSLRGVKLSDHWLGLVCRPADDTLRAQLGLPDGCGLVVDRVMPDTPAAKVGIERHDVLLNVGDKSMKTLAELMKTVDEAKDKELAITLIRGGKSQTVKATPAKRPEGMAGGQSAIFIEGPYEGVVEGPLNLLERLRKRSQLQGDLLRYQIVHPGVVLPPKVAIHPPLPGNVSVSINKSGDEPATIVVIKGDQKWEVTEDEIDELPADIRPSVEVMVGPRSLMLKQFKFDTQHELKSKYQTPTVEGNTRVIRRPKQLDKQIDEMNRRIEELRKSIDQLHKHVPSEEESPKEGS